jgi:hypothetical protein
VSLVDSLLKSCAQLIPEKLPSGLLWKKPVDLRRFSSGKPAELRRRELLYFRDLCSESNAFPHGPTAITTKKKKNTFQEEETWS